eukprot:6353942-Lingulodinium_polyedra.AAC.2
MSRNCRVRVIWPPPHLLQMDVAQETGGQGTRLLGREREKVGPPFERLLVDGIELVHPHLPVFALWAPPEALPPAVQTRGAVRRCA